MIQAIETLYNGYRFRSRLEARWAVFFDAAGIKYEYEPEGYQLSDGTMYLPDFYLPDFDVFVEVKPNREGSLQELQKAVSMIRPGSPITRLAILSDIPAQNDYDGGLWHFPCLYLDNRKRKVASGWLFFSDLSPAANVTITAGDYPEPFLIEDGRRLILLGADSLLAVSDNKLTNDPIHRSITTGEYFNFNRLFRNERVFTAFDKARQARFEHGEKP